MYALARGNMVDLQTDSYPPHFLSLSPPAPPSTSSSLPHNPHTIPHFSRPTAPSRRSCHHSNRHHSPCRSVCCYASRWLPRTSTPISKATRGTSCAQCRPWLASSCVKSRVGWRPGRLRSEGGGCIDALTPSRNRPRQGLPPPASLPSPPSRHRQPRHQPRELQKAPPQRPRSLPPQTEAPRPPRPLPRLLPCCWGTRRTR